MAVNQVIYDGVFRPNTRVISIGKPGYYKICSGSYDKLFVPNNNDSGTEIEIDPSTTFAGGFQIDGDKVTITVDVNFTSTGVLAFTGVSCSLIGSGSATIEGISASGNNFYVDGGGKGFIVRPQHDRIAIDISSDNIQVRNLYVDTETNDFNKDAINLQSSAHCLVYDCLIEAGQYGIFINNTCPIILNNHFKHYDTRGIDSNNSNITIISNNYFESAGGISCNLRGTSKNIIVSSNTSKTSGTSFSFGSSTKWSICAGNRALTAASDSGTDNIVTNNLIAAFT